MEFQNYEERFFWKKIYHACIRSGRTAEIAKREADDSTEFLRWRPVVRKPLPNQ